MVGLGPHPCDMMKKKLPGVGESEQDVRVNNMVYIDNNTEMDIWDIDPHQHWTLTVRPSGQLSLGVRKQPGSLEAPYCPPLSRSSNLRKARNPILGAIGEGGADPMLLAQMVISSSPVVKMHRSVIERVSAKIKSITSEHRSEDISLIPWPASMDLKEAREVLDRESRDLRGIEAHWKLKGTRFARVRRGMKGLTKYGRDQIYSGCALMEKKYGKDNLGFGLLTIPTYSREGQARLHENWSKVMRDWREWMTYHLVRSGFEPDLLAVYEVQEGRFHRYGEPVLHVHYVFPWILNGEKWLKDRDVLKYWWALCNRYAEERAKRYWKGQKIQRVEKDVSGYISKYVSKGTAVIKKMVEEGFSGWVPKSWMMMTQSVKIMIREATVVLYSVPIGCLQMVLITLMEKAANEWFEWVGAVDKSVMPKKGVQQVWAARIRATARFMSNPLAAIAEMA
jgi:hypothetical protein